MLQEQVTLEFNSAITGLNKDTGAWDEKIHNGQVMPLRGLVMQIDGACGCHIDRYTMTVSYVVAVTNRDFVIAACQNAVRKVATWEGFFPLANGKDVEVTPVATSKQT